MTQPDDSGPVPERPARWGFRKEIEPGVWVAACRACPKRFRPRHKFASSKEVTKWWKEHRATEVHRQNTSPEAIQRRHEESAWLARIFGRSNERTEE